MKSMEMELQKVHLIRLDKGEELLSCILSYVEKKSILAGFLTGIGALGKGIIGYFDTKKREYLHLPFKDVELLACSGNISKNKDTDKPVAHIHILIGEKDGKSYGGHLVEGIVSVTAEIYLVETRPIVYRTKDDATGLYLLSPKD